MHAFIIVGPKGKNREDKIEEILSKIIAKKIPLELQKIDDVRELKKMVKFTFSENTAFVINDIDSASNETVNAFLKNLEEPNKNVFYVLTTSNINSVLSTIISRCEVIHLNNNESSVTANDIDDFLNQSINKKLEYVGKIKDRLDAIQFIENIINLEHKNKQFKNMENCLNILNNLKANGNVSLQLTAFVVTMNR